MGFPRGMDLDISFGEYAVRKIEQWVLEEVLRQCEDPRYSTVKEYQPNDVIFSVGDPGDYMAILLAGQVEIKRHGSTLAKIDFGSVFGEMGLIDGVPRGADAIAVTNCRIARVREGQFTSMLERTPRFALSMMRLLTDRVRASTVT